MQAEASLSCEPNKALKMGIVYDAANDTVSDSSSLYPCIPPMFESTCLHLEACLRMTRHTCWSFVKFTQNIREESRSI
jgi:protein involved in temperature-dependent protein secretion